jgi:hypothetical protein
MQLDLPTKNVNLVNHLRTIGNIATYKDLFNTCLTVFYWCMQEVQSGRVIASLDEETGKYKELSVPAFQYARFQAEEAARLQAEEAARPAGKEDQAAAATGGR